MAVQMRENSAAERASEGGSTPLRASVWKLLPVVAGEAAFSLSAEIEAYAGITALLGPSGAGKTTLLDCIAGIIRPDKGRVSLGDRVLFDSGTNLDLSPAERNVGYVFQTLALFPHLTAQQNVEFGIAQLTPPERRRRSDAMLEIMRISGLRNRRPRELSGGERQRVALARALVTEPSVLLLDEPLAALDFSTKSRIIDDLRAWNDRRQISMLYVTHSREEVFALANHVVVLEKGRIVAGGSPYDVLEAPRHQTAAEWAGFENIFDATVLAEDEQRGTTTVALGSLRLEVPLARHSGGHMQIGIRAGDILLATQEPAGISARNVIRGSLVSLTRHDTVMIARVDCGAHFAVHLTPHAAEALRLGERTEVWLIIKTHSCHVLRKSTSDL